MNPRRISIIGLITAFLALAVNPILDAIGILVLRPGLIISVLAPLVLASVAIVCGLQVRAMGDSKWGTRIILSGIAAFILGAIWGVTGVI